METRARVADGRSQRDELEQLQEELLDVRRQSTELPLENAGLAAEVARLEEEVRSLRKARDVARAEWEKPLSSLPAQLVPPFCATPSRRTRLGRARHALRAWRSLILIQGGLSFYMGIFSRRGPPWAFMIMGAMSLWLVLAYVFSKHHEAEDERLAWSFEDEGFGLIGEGDTHRQVLYSEVRKVEVKQGWLLRRFGLGSVQVTWVPPAPTTLGKAAGLTSRVLESTLLDEPHRLAEWLLERTEEARRKDPGGQRVA